MIRVLVMIAVAGFFVSLVTIVSAVAIGGPVVLESAAWNGWTGHWNHHGDWDGWGWDDDRGGGRRERGGESTRDLAWTGGDSLDLDVPADVRYTQGPVAKVTVSGPARAVDDLVIEDGHIRYAHGHHHHWGGRDVSIVMTAPSVTRFGISGSGDLTIDGFKQDKLEVRISGNGDVNVSGETSAVQLNVSGSGDADLSRLKTKTAEVDISGSGDAKLAPTESARIEVSGSGDVTLLTHPPHVESHISGSGTLNEDAGPAQSAEPAPAPTTPEPPKKKGKAA